MSRRSLREATEDVDYAIRKMGDGAILLRSVFAEMAENQPEDDQLAYLIEAQEHFRIEAAAAVQDLWEQIFAMEKAARS